MKIGKSRLKIPQFLNLGAVLPTQYAESILSLQSQQVTFINLELSKTAIQNGFFIVKQQQNEFHIQIKFVLKPGKQINICVAAYAKQLKKSSNFSGQLYLHEQGIMHTIQLVYRIQIPKILSKKMLICGQNQKIYRIMINKAITNEARIMLQNQQNYQLGLEVNLLYPMNLQNKENPFLLKIKTLNCVAKPKEAFVIFVTIETNIGYKKQFKGIKKCIFRNVLTLKTGSQLFYTLPLEIIVVFIKEPEIKSQ